MSMEIENHSGVKFCRTWVIVETGRSLAVAVSSFVCVSPIADCRTDCVDGFEKCVLTKFRSGEISIFEESVPVMMTQLCRLLGGWDAECGNAEIKVLHHSIQVQSI